jgi:hypothetical protein
MAKREYGVMRVDKSYPHKYEGVLVYERVKDISDKRFKVLGANKWFDTEEEAAKEYDKSLIYQGKKPVNGFFKSKEV